MVDDKRFLMRAWSAQNNEQIFEFVFDFFRLGDRVSDFLSQQCTIPFSQAVCRDPNGRFCGTQLRCRLSIIRCVTVEREKRLQDLELRSFTGFSLLVSQTVQHSVEKRECPFAFKKSFRSDIVRGLGQESRFPRVPVECRGIK